MDGAIYLQPREPLRCVPPHLIYWPADSTPINFEYYRGLFDSKRFLLHIDQNCPLPSLCTLRNFARKIDGHHPVAFSDIGPMNRIEKLSDLARRMHNLTETIQDGSDVEERTRHLAHELRTRLGVALILAEGLARDEGNKSMVAVEEDGTTGHISYDIALGETLSETNIADVNLQ